MTRAAGARSRAKPRAQRQRDRILDAARRNFVRHGFHAASMAEIAATAGMSAGLIYRYFRNKSAIILAIIQRQLEENSRSIDQLPTNPDWDRRLGDLFRRWQRGEDSLRNAALLLDLSAEATRDPRIARAVTAADRASRARFQAWLAARAAEAGAPAAGEELRARALALQCFIEGMAIRAAREPDLDPKIVAAALRTVLPHLLPPGKG